MRKRPFSALKLAVQLLTNQIASPFVLALLSNNGRIRPFDLIYIAFVDTLVKWPIPANLCIMMFGANQACI